MALGAILRGQSRHTLLCTVHLFCIQERKSSMKLFPNHHVAHCQAQSRMALCILYRKQEHAVITPLSPLSHLLIYHSCTVYSVAPVHSRYNFFENYFFFVNYIVCQKIILTFFHPKLFVNRKCSILALWRKIKLRRRPLMLIMDNEVFYVGHN